ncbi:NitT/TauT family transport system substrate-binding protein [Halopenitus malekzadehii]|uniref:NitT/TauT family transport system substrate-binding protein n=1 Tax=Halopenitus malekzadehii TaxID=1267564 RepID=A0A1H6IF21_9EURY|nr:ABC transporter substrate-binding protein [Halopenitus malekzadehii]SEH45766.1 NitT/TauT family transport system substrate-binding protein [Halopenitus malekzadehii]
MNGPTTSTRRGFLSAAGGSAAVGLAGCLGGSGGGLDEVTVAHMPIYPDLQWYVMEGEGFLADVDAEIVGQEFTDGPAIIQALGGGDIDVAMFGIVPSIIAIDRGLPVKVTAANIHEMLGIMADEEFQSLWEEHGAEAFAVWEEQTGSPFEFGTFPQGSTPDVFLRHWLSDGLGLDPDSDVTITEINGASAVWQAIANGEVDGTSIMEPVPTIASEEGADVSLFKTAAEIMPGQPGAVVTMSDTVRESDLAGQFLSAHVRATEFIQENPDETAGHVEEGIGMPEDRARTALESPLSNFITDPREIESGTEVFARFAEANGQTDEQRTIDEIFDYSVYEGL